MDPLKHIMGITEAADRWGIESSTIKKMCQRGELPAVKIGDTWIMRRDQERPVIATRRRRRSNETDQAGD